MPFEPRLSVRARVAGHRTDRPRLDIELEVPEGVTVVMGPSGAGKTTLLATIAGLLRPDAGRVLLDGEVLYDAEAGRFVPPHRRRVSLVFQSLALFPHRSAWQNVAYGLRDTPRRARKERAMAYLAQTRADHVAERLPSTLSGGEAQRVALARALAAKPRALLLDEPFSALDPELRRDLVGELGGLVDEAKIPTLVVTHDRRDAEALSSRTILLREGRRAPQ